MFQTGKEIEVITQTFRPSSDLQIVRRGKLVSLDEQGVRIQEGEDARYFTWIPMANVHAVRHAR